MEDNNDVELNALLGITSETTTHGASAENSEENKSSSTATDDSAATKKEDESSQRAQERIRELVEENNRLKQPKTDAPVDMDSFLSKINDEGTRNLLKEFGTVVQATVEKQYKPVLSSYQDDRFEKEFAVYVGKLPNLAHHKEQLKKEFIRNPNADLKGVVGNLAMDILTSKVKPLETKTTQAPRDEVAVNLDNASKEDLYAMLNAKKQR